MSDGTHEPEDNDPPDLLREPEDDAITPDDVREEQARFQGHLAESDDYQEAVDAQIEGEEPEDPRPNPSRP